MSNIESLLSSISSWYIIVNFLGKINVIIYSWLKQNQREMGIGNDKISAVCLFVLLWCLKKKKKKKKEKLQFFNCQKTFLRTSKRRTVG